MREKLDQEGRAVDTKLGSTPPNENLSDSLQEIVRQFL